MQSLHNQIQYVVASLTFQLSNFLYIAFWVKSTSNSRCKDNFIMPKERVHEMETPEQSDCKDGILFCRHNTVCCNDQPPHFISERFWKTKNCQLHIFFTLTCNWTERSRSPWTMGLNLSMDRRSPAVVIASRTFSKLNEKWNAWAKQWQKMMWYLFTGILTSSLLLQWSFLFWLTKMNDLFRINFILKHDRGLGYWWQSKTELYQLIP